MLAAGLTNAEIARALVSRRPPSEPCLQPAWQGLRDRIQAVIYAYETRLIAPADG